jgi:hypothetical protein
MPAASKAFCKVAKFALVLFGSPSEASIRLIVLMLTPVNAAISETLHRSACLAILICVDVSIDNLTF